MPNLKMSVFVLTLIMALSGCSSTQHVNERTKSSSSGMDDAASPRLTDSAQRDYLNLRERIGIATNQIAGLQAYITDVCLAK